ncbi:hypothetical protein C4J81_04855 [Deltaproteobacteria bacterium Smac51]|nr:hypothetical protein C4J81_04855 [Deltaproteobacteria bacterium Smac51]
MRKLIASVLFLAMVIMAPTALANSENIKQFTVNEVTVYPIQDSQGEMDVSLFSGPLSAQERAAYMPGGKAPASINVFLLKTPSGNVLVDTGWGKSGPGGQALTDLIKLSGLGPDDIDVVVLTHMHPDHIGGLLNGHEPFFSRARVMVSAPELSYWAKASATSPPAAEQGDDSENLPAEAGDEPGFDPLAVPMENEGEAVVIEGEAAAPLSDEAVEEVAPADEAAAPEAEELPVAPGASADNRDETEADVLAVAIRELPRAVIAAYGDRLTTFEFGSEVVPGLTAVEAVGHTPGHTALLLKSGERQLLFIGDLIHAAALQFPEPDECTSYDQDKAPAIGSRKVILSMAADGNLPVAGAHIPFPGIGFVKPDGKRGFTFTPVQGSGS